MHFTNLFTLSALAAATLAQSTSPDYTADYNASPCASVPAAYWQEVGGNTGTFWCETAWGGDHSPITGIEVWRSPQSGGDHVAGIRFQYASTGDWSTTYGHQDTSSYPSQILSLASGELITSLILYGNGKGQYLGHIHIETSRGQVFDAGRDTSGITPYPADTAGGIILGAFGQQGQGPEDSDSDLVDLAFLFIKDHVSSVSVQNVTYDTSSIANNGVVNPSQINVGTYYNHADTTVNVGQSQTLSVTQSHQFTQSSTSTYNFSENIDISAKVFGIGVDSDTSFSWQQTSSTTNTISDSETTTLNCNFNAPVAPNTGIQATGTFANGTTSVPYTSTVVINLQDGSNYSYQEKGQLSAASYYSCNTVTTQDNNPGLQNTATDNGPAPGASSENSTSSSSSSLTVPSSTASSSASSVPTGIQTGPGIVLPNNATSATSASATSASATSASAAPTAARVPPSQYNSTLPGTNSTNSLAPNASGTGTGLPLSSATSAVASALHDIIHIGVPKQPQNRRLVDTTKSGKQMRRWAA